MGKLTKNAKRVSIIFKKVESTTSEYTCPTCLITFMGAGIGKNIIRFKCRCGQELVVN